MTAFLNGKEPISLCDELLVHPDVTKKALGRLPEEDRLIDLAELFKIFGDSTRVKILYLLLEAEMCVCDIADSLQMTVSAISHQLRILKQNKLVKSRREGKQVFYSLADGHVQTIIGQGMEHILEE